MSDFLPLQVSMPNTHSLPMCPSTQAGPRYQQTTMYSSLHATPGHVACYNNPVTGQSHRYPTASTLTSTSTMSLLASNAAHTNDLKEEVKHLKQKLENATSENLSLSTKYVNVKKDMEAQQKKLNARERQLKQRESTVKQKEEELSSYEQEVALLKATCSKLEQKIDDLQQENRSFKLKLLASEDLRSSNDQRSANMSSASQGPLETLAASFTTMAAAIMANANTANQQTHSAAPIRITNVCNPQPRRQWRRPEHQDWRQRDAWPRSRESPGSDHHNWRQRDAQPQDRETSTHKRIDTKSTPATTTPQTTTTVPSQTPAADAPDCEIPTSVTMADTSIPGPAIQPENQDPKATPVMQHFLGQGTLPKAPDKNRSRSPPSTRMESDLMLHM